MRFPFAFLSTLVLLLSGCVGSRAQAPKQYSYAMPCRTWTEPAHVVVNKVAVTADTTLALISGRIVNYDSTNNRGYDTHNPVYIILTKDDSTKKEATLTDKTGSYRLYVPVGTYQVKFTGLDFSPFSVKQVALLPTAKRQLDVFLHVQSPTSSTCMTEYKSNRKLSPEQLKALRADFARQDEERTRRYLQRLKTKSGTK